MNNIALNFFPISPETFDILLYYLPYSSTLRPSMGTERAVRRKLSIDGEFKVVWTIFQQTTEGNRIVCRASENQYLTIDALRTALIQSCESVLDPHQFRVYQGIRRHVEIITSEFEEGTQVTSIEPYYLQTTDQFGFLADFRFRPHPRFRKSRKALELSLSLDKNGRQNLNYYADRYTHLQNFVKHYLAKLSPLILPGGEEIQISTRIVTIKAQSLKTKRYVVHNDRSSTSQFMGIKSHGPLKPASPDTQLYFLYRQVDRALARDLYRALHGDLYRTFEGMNKMFDFPFSRANVTGISLTDFTAEEIQRVRNTILNDSDRANLVPIILTPFSRYDEPEENAPYWYMKHAFLSRGLPIQVVSTDTVANRDTLKWSTASIALQIFAKAGGTPWKILPRISNCLVIGIGQAHQFSNDSIHRYFAYSVLTDSSGIFAEVRVLADDRDEGKYIDRFSTSLRQIIADYSNDFSRFVVHTTFRLRKLEMDCIARLFDDIQNRNREDSTFVVLKFNDRNRFFGYAINHNSRVPYESSFIQLSNNQFLVWFEGLQYGRTTILKKIAGPLHLEFIYPRRGMTRKSQYDHLQNSINLSGANWRGFNAKALPISVYYAQLIARYLREFDVRELERVDVGILRPWFL